jgi:predicted lipid-binding transport protein (Tim44 family)
MNRYDKEIALEAILARLKGDASILMLSELLDGEVYTARDIHRWAAEEKDLPFYDKIREILEVRIARGMNKGEVNAQLGLKMLGEFFERGTDKGSGEIVFKVVEEELGL